MYVLVGEGVLVGVLVGVFVGVGVNVKVAVGVGVGVDVGVAVGAKNSVKFIVGTSSGLLTTCTIASEIQACSSSSSWTKYHIEP